MCGHEMLSQMLYKVNKRAQDREGSVCCCLCVRKHKGPAHTGEQGTGRAEQEMGCGEPVEKGSGFQTGGH